MLPGPVCFLSSCASDAECADCSNGRTMCDTSTNRCVACTPSNMGACTGMQTCSAAGTCIPMGATCPSSCTMDADCAPCGATQQACNTALGICAECSETDTSACNGNQHCDATGACADNCPTGCTVDADCAQCATAQGAAPACNVATGACGECSGTTPCSGGEICSPQGVCVPICGQAGKPKGVCTEDSHCSGCGADNLACHVPINGGDGRCGVPASGCSDLGMGVAVLPSPWDSITNTCSDDADCSQVGLDLNVGKLLRDLTGLDFINDATTQYPMNACAAVEVGLPSIGSVSCGVCVPCRVDDDCTPIQIDPLVDQMFDGLASIAAKFALDKLFGDRPHVLNLRCENVAGDYGVCVPCLDPSSGCGVSSTTGNGCQNVWECAGGEFCNDQNMCEAVPQSCFIGGMECTGGDVCAWNGGDYCCRPPFTGTQSCTSDGECGSQVCAYNGMGFFCVDPIPSCM